MRIFKFILGALPIALAGCGREDKMEFEVAHECVGHSCAVYVEPLSQTYVDQLVKKVMISEVRHDVRQVNHSLKWYGLEGGNYIDSDILTELDLKQCGDSVCDDTKNPVAYQFQQGQEYVSLDVLGKMTVNNKEYDINKKYNFVIELISAPVISGKCNDENVCVFSVTKDSEGGAKPYNYYWYDGYQNVAITKSTVDNGDFKYELKDNLKHSIVMSTGDKYGRNYSEDSNEVVVYADMYKAPTVEILSEDAVAESKQALLAAEAVAYGNKTIPKDGYNWTVPEGWEIVSGQGTNLLVVKVPGYSKDMPKGEFSVVATDSEGVQSNTATKEVAVLFDSSLKPTQPSLLAADLNGQKDVVENTEYKVTATVQAGAGRKIVGYEWNVNGTKVETTTNVLTQTAPAFNAIADNKIRVTVIAIDSAGQRSDESAEIGIDVKADSSIKPTKPSLLAADLNGQKDVVENKEYKVTATATASAGRKIVGYEWNVNGTKVETKTNVLTQTAPAFNAIADNKIRVTVIAIDDGGVKSEESAEIGIDVKADSSIKPTKPSLLAADLNGQKDVVENTEYKVTATATASAGRKIVGYEWNVNGTKVETKTNVLTQTAPAFNAIADNKIRVTVIAIDDGGVKSEESAEIGIDVKADSSIKPTKPSLLAADLNGQTDVVENKEYKVTATATASAGRKIVGYEWNVNGTKVETKTNVLTQTAPAFNAIADNKIRVTVIAIDDGGVKSEESAEIGIDVKADSSIKPTKPSLLAADLNGQTDVVENKEYKVTATATASAGRKIVGYEWNVNGTKVETKTNVLTQTAPAFNAIADNKIRVTVIAIDDGGVKSEESAEIGIDVKADSSIKPTKPSLLAADLNGQTDVVENKEYKVTATATASAGRKIVGYEWNVNGTKVETKTNVLTQTAPAFNAIADNKIRVTVVAIDDGGVKSEESAEIGIDVKADSSIKPTKPSLLAADLNGQTDVVENKEYKVTATATASAGRKIVGYEWNVNGTKVETKTNVLTQTAPAFNAIADNKIRVTVVAIDSAGQRSDESAEIGIDVKADSSIPGPTNVSLTAPNKAKEGSRVTLTASATVANGRKIKSYTWIVGNNTQTTTDPSYQVTIPSYDVDNPNLKVKVKVTDSANKTAESKESSVGIEVDATIAGPTNASISGANEAKEGTQVALTASATVANGRKIKAYKWTVEGGKN
ncbi:hypothetical protein [Francisella tularensis]|uniref:hypothetical protein n=2 Tax=Francisella tularensis TaxID=263 RepID=UPI000B072F2D|nr:hypothetical protein [Francisella tularensis]